MTGARVYPALLLAVTLAGCSGAERPTLAPPATPRTFELGWKERSAEPGFEFRVGRIVITENGWRATISVTNRTRSAYRIGRQTVGLVLLETPSAQELQELTDGLERSPPSLSPQRVRPGPPGILRAGASWNAVLEGDTVLRRGSFARVLFGPFTRIGQRTREEPADILWVTDHVVRL